MASALCLEIEDESDVDEVALCLHCEERPGSKNRGLCRVCHKDLGIRDQYPNDWSHARELDLGDCESLEPEWPTMCLPGTEGKVQVMEARVSRGESAFHRRDARLNSRRTDECQRERLEPGECREPWAFRRLEIETKKPAPVEEMPVVMWPRDDRTGQLLLWVECLLWRSRARLFGRRW